MYFDTGAAGITFSQNQAKALNITIPEDAISTMHTGIGGTTGGQDFAVNRMRLGPIDKTNVMISVITHSQMRYPLLGQTFFGEWQFTIDNSQNLIRFVRR